MDEKRRLPLHLNYPRTAEMTAPVRRRRTRLWLPILALVLIGYSLLSTYNVDVRGRLDKLSKEAKSSAAKAVSTKRKVPLEAHIISKCPDTRDALRQLLLPAMQQVYDKVDFKLSYIGSLIDGGVKCKHGPSECLGNIIELCARELYPDPKISLGFVMCLTRDYQHIPERSLIEDCALEHAIDIKKLNDCATQDDGAYGLDLLRTSVQHSSDVNATISCTIRLDDQVYCIRDGGEWKNCSHGSSVNDLVLALACLAQRVRHGHGVHAGLVVAPHDPERLDDAVQAYGLARRLRRARLERDVDNVNMEMIVAQRPNVPPLHQRQQVQRVQRRPVPVEVRQQQEPLVPGLAQLGPVDYVLDLLAALDDVEDPVEPPLVALALHVRPDLVAVDGGRLRHEPHPLLAVLFHVRLRARVDEVDLEVRVEVGRGLARRVRARTRHVPAVDVVGAQVLEARERGRQASEVALGRRERRALDDEQRGLAVHRANHGCATPSLICR
ncbi:hypothetical protein PWT90_07780 [Aphanocladium album]|nr:hypothetical protein PWT90_07780 [Aphanocladium album]